MNRAFTLETLLATQARPLLVVNRDGSIRGANQPLAQFLGLPSTQLLGQNCCRLDAAEEPLCRHRRFFQDLEPYVETRTLSSAQLGLLQVQVQGFPLLDLDGTLYLAESLLPLGGVPTDEGLVGRSPAFVALRQQLTRAATGEAPVLLLGETGVGKELAAQFIHRHSARANGPFVVVDCTVLSEDLFESELFGHLKGAFTGAAGNKTGLFELAHGGTLFLDEIGDLPLSQQPKLLRALETGTFRPVGATQTRRADLRVVSATHQDLGAMVQRGTFRRDLYFRLAVLPLEVPPLRRRREDIPLLADHILQEMGRVNGRNLRLRRESLAQLLVRDFPGNVRELRNLLQLGATLSPDGEIAPDHLRVPEQAPAPDGPATTGSVQPASRSPLETAEAAYILGLLQRYGGSRKQVAAGMNVSERTLYRKLKRYGLNTAYDQTTDHA
jgi:DNA-binding NtrC family response regulator